MKRSIPAVFILLLSTALFACAKSDSPTGPIMLSGTYYGPAVDPSGAGFATWNLSQSGSAVSGSFIGRSPSSATGLTGQISGTLTGSTLTYSISATGTDPICSFFISGRATNVTSSRIVASYSGTSTCGYPFSGGTFRLDKQ